jgi:hypothetical protein
MRMGLASALVLSLAMASRAAEQPGGIEEKGQFSVASPGEGLAWKKVQEAEQKGVKISVYAAVKENSKSRIVMIVEHQEADTDPKKVARIKGAYNGMVHGLQQAGLKELKGPQPDLKTPVAKKVEFAFAGKDAEGQPAFARGAVVFGKRVYQFQVLAGSEQDAVGMVKVVDTLKEQ